MIRFATILVGLCLSGVGFGQSAPKLGEPKAVDIGTSWVQWSPVGDCLAYRKDVDSGIVLGLYQVGAPQGTVLLRLAKGDACNFEWFKGQDAALVNVNHTEGDETRVTLYLLEARTPTPVKLFEQTAAASDNPSVDMNLSPLLEHAIFDVHLGEHSYHLILPVGGTALVPSNDLDVADKQGYLGPKWGSSGTAFYLDRKTADALQTKPLPNSGSPTDQLLKALLDTFIDQQAHPTPSGDSNVDAANQAVLSSQIQSFKDRLTPAPPAGDAGLELMPDVGVLRQVNSPGPWKDTKVVAFGVDSQTSPANVIAGPLTGKSQSLWLTASDKSWWVLVAPSAQQSWLSPTGKAIAYTVDGALFVRSFAR